MPKILCSPEALAKGHYPAKCPKCGFTGCSSEWIAGHQLGETDDLTDAQCPICFTTEDCTETGNTQNGSDFKL